MSILEYFNRSPFRELVGIEVTEAADGHAEGHLELAEEHSSTRADLVAQGGVTYTLADSVGGAAAVSLYEVPTPTVDFRIDYLRPATDDLHATGDVRRDGDETATVDVAVHDATGARVADGRGVYQTSGLPDDAPWSLDHE
ncbi:MAG: hypothetical protein A07HB70_01687 [uncultured archaeon A07HB70]|nr:MAG: hypothetical protein A07HB70_01687 [uncultured archaeon A07HB70]